MEDFEPPILGLNLARFWIWLWRTFLRTISVLPRFSKNPHFFWELRRLWRHPHHYRGALGFLLEISNTWVIVLFTGVHILFALLIAGQIEIISNSTSDAHSAISSWDKFYFSITNQISPGFTEYIPNDNRSQRILAAQSFFGTIFNALLFALIVAKLFFPSDVFEVSNLILHNPKTNSLVIRLYSKYPGTVFDLEAKFFRFVFEENENQRTIGRTEEIPITPTDRKMLLKNYGLLLSVPVLIDQVDWTEDTRDSPLEGMPYNWFQSDVDMLGHFYLVLSAETSTGKVYQVINFFLGKETFRCGHHHLLNRGMELNTQSWYNYTLYNWSTWNKFDKADCSQCKLPNCMGK